MQIQIKQYRLHTSGKLIDDMINADIRLLIQFFVIVVVVLCRSHINYHCS